MINIKDIRYYLILFIVFTNCSSSLDSEEYISWIQNRGNGIQNTKSIGKLTFEVQYKPKEYMALQEFGGKISDPHKYRELLKELGDMEYFELRVGMKDNSKLEDYILKNGVENPVYYLAYQLQNEIFLEVGENKNSVALFHYERSHDLKPFKTFLLAFERDGKEVDRILVIDAQGFKTGPVKIAIKKEDLQNIPKLDIG